MVDTPDQMTLLENDQPEPEYTLLSLSDLPSNAEIGGLEPTKDFVRSLALYGLLSPIRVACHADGRYTIIYGRRRVRAARLLGWTLIPALVVPPGADDGMASVHENLARAADQRQEIKVILDLAAQGTSIADIRKVLPGRTIGQIKKVLKLQRLVPALQEAVVTGRMLPTAAYQATDLKGALQEQLVPLLAQPKKVIGPSDVEPLKRVQTQGAQQQFLDLFAQEVPTADEVAQAAGRWQTRAASTLRALLPQIPDDHPAHEALEQALDALDAGAAAD